MNELRARALLDASVERGGVVADYHGQPVVRSFGDPAAEYRAATTGAAVVDRSHRVRLTVSGRAPAKMLNGVLTGRMPVAPSTTGDGVSHGEATYHTVLTPKGKMITDLWALLPGEEASPGLLLDVPVAGGDGLRANFTKVLPPRFAAVRDVSDVVGSISIVGPEAPAAVSRLALGLRVEAESLAAAPEGSYWLVGAPDEALIVMRTEEVWPVALTVYGPARSVEALWDRLVAEGVTAAGLGVWSTLRVEAGRPAFGTDMDEDTIPVEAGIHERAIDNSKGCYTGQEVIVRIRDRGRVNRHLRRLSLGDVATPPAGTELLAPDGSGKVVGRVTSAVHSPRDGGVVALAYVRRELETVTLDGREVRVIGGQAPTG